MCGKQLCGLLSSANDFILERDCILDENIRKEVADHICDLDTNLAKYFPPMKKNDWEIFESRKSQPIPSFRL